MSHTMLSRYSELLLTIYRLAQDKPVSEFQDAMLEAIKDIIPFDSSMWGTAIMKPSGIDIHSMHLHRSSEAMLVAYEEVKHLDTAAARVTQTEYATIAFNSDIEFAAEDKKSIRALCDRFGHRNCLITCNINPYTKFAHWLSLYRKEADHLCTADETRMLANLAPHVMQALAINRIIHMDRLVGDVARERWCVAIADTRGIPYHVGKTFWAFLDLEWDTGARDRLPPELLQGLLAHDRVVGKEIVVQRSLEQDLMYLKVRRRERVDNLSPREYLVAKLLASGLSHKEVAKKLERSPATVSTQIRAIFDKLKISNAVMLAPHLASRDWSG